MTETMVTLTHRGHPMCDLTKHVAPVGFDADEPTFDYHGESIRPEAVAEQCMCGHVPYISCPDYLDVWRPSRACEAKKHGDCDESGFNDFTNCVEPRSCSCKCHDLPISEAIADQKQHAA